MIAFHFSNQFPSFCSDREYAMDYILVWGGIWFSLFFTDTFQSSTFLPYCYISFCEQCQFPSAAGLPFSLYQWFLIYFVFIYFYLRHP